jgi:hypothetical protein
MSQLEHEGFGYWKQVPGIEASMDGVWMVRMAGQKGGGAGLWVLLLKATYSRQLDCILREQGTPEGRSRVSKISWG